MYAITSEHIPDGVNILLWNNGLALDMETSALIPIAPDTLVDSCTITAETVNTPSEWPSST